MFELIEAMRIEGVCAEARARVPADLPQLQDHFPGALLLPGTLLIELMAQTAGPLLEETGDAPRWAVLGLVRHASFLAPTPLPAAIELSAEVVRREPSSGVARTEATVEGEVRARAELVFSLQPRDPAWGAAIAARDARLASWLAAWEGE